VAIVIAIVAPLVVVYLFGLLGNAAVA